MECARSVMFLFLSQVLLLALLNITSTNALPPAWDFPAIYNFGDWNLDTGGISASFEPIQAPYGESFFRGLAGRFSDGRLLIDFIGNITSNDIIVITHTEIYKSGVCSRLIDCGLPYLSA